MLGERDRKILGDSWMTSYFTQETELQVYLEVLSQWNRVDHDRAGYVMPFISSFMDESNSYAHRSITTHRDYHMHAQTQ